MIRQIVYFFITLAIMYSLMVTSYLVMNNLFNADFVWIFITSFVATLLGCIAIYFFEKKYNKVKPIKEE